MSFISEYIRTGVWKSEEASLVLGSLSREIESSGLAVIVKPPAPKPDKGEEPKLSIKDKINRFQSRSADVSNTPPIKGKSSFSKTPVQNPSSTPPSSLSSSQLHQSSSSIQYHHAPKRDDLVVPKVHDSHSSEKKPEVVAQTTSKSENQVSQESPLALPNKFRVSFGAVTEQGERPYNEDRFSAYEQLPGDMTSSYFGVFDGHGGINGSVLC